MYVDGLAFLNQQTLALDKAGAGAGACACALAAAHAAICCAVSGCVVHSNRDAQLSHIHNTFHRS